MTVRRVTEVSSGIIEDGRGLVLLAQRPPGKLFEGLWEFPGGKLEPGESAAQALKRELQEELCLDIRIEGSLGTYPFAYESFEILLHVFVVHALNEPQATADVQVFRWIDPRLIDFETLVHADREPLVQYFAQQSRPATP